MSESLINSVVSIGAAIVGLAVIAVIVSRNANTAGVLSAAGSSFSQAIGAAVSPVTGGSGFTGVTGPLNFNL